MGVCIGCLLGAGTFITMWSGGRLIEWRANFQRRRAMRKVEREAEAGARPESARADEGAPEVARGLRPAELPSR